MTNKDIIANNFSYWKDRNVRSQANLAKKNKATINKQLNKYYKSAMQNTIADFVSTYEKILDAVKDGKAPTPADLYKLDKYWKMEAQLKKNLEKLGTNEEKVLHRNFILHWKGIYESVAKSDDLGFNKLDDKAISQIINHIWCADGLSWSQRVWKNTDKLQSALNDALVDCVIRGKKTSELKKMIQYQFGVDFNRANTLVQTEMAHIQTQAAKQRYQDMGVEEVQIWADEDERRCDVCGEYHQKIYNINEQIPVPLHPNCRCCIVPVVKK